MTFGEKLQRLRKQRGLSQDGLAGELHVTRQAVSKWERNEAQPDLQNVVKLSRLFGVSTDDLLLEERENIPSAMPSQKLSPRDRRLKRIWIIGWVLTGVGLLGEGLIWLLSTMIKTYTWTVNAWAENAAEAEEMVMMPGYSYQGFVETYHLHDLVGVLGMVLMAGVVCLVYHWQTKKELKTDTGKGSNRT